MTRPNSTPVEIRGFSLAPPEPAIPTGPAGTEQLPQLRIWACYPTGHRPESVEITYDGPEPVGAEFIGQIVASLQQVTAPGYRFRFDPPDQIDPGSITMSADRINKGNLR